MLRRRHGALAAAAAAGLTLAAACAPRDPRPNVLLVTLDTTRADHLGAYGAAFARTPVFDRLAAEGTLFERAWTTVPLTTPAHASLMTSLYPEASGVRNNGLSRIPEQAKTLAEAFRDAGYRTAGFVAAFPVSRAFGFAQGFDRFDDDLGHVGATPRAERPADEVNARAVPWIAERLARGDGPFFAWVHYYDAHDPYAPPPPFAEAFRGREYDGEIAFADSKLGEIVELLDRRHALDRTVIAVVGDHGEGLGDHGEPTHGLLVYEPMIHVPLVVRAPWKVPRGARERGLTSLVDVGPTLLALAGVPAPPSHGRDLFAPEAAPGAEAAGPFDRGPGRVLYAESFYAHDEFGWAPLIAVRRAGQKWIAAPVPERYDLDADPGEARSLAGADPARDRAMQAVLEEAAAAASRGAVASSPAEGSEDLVARLQSLGYVGGGAGPARSGGSPAARDPKDAVADYREYLRGTNLLGSGAASEALEVFERLAARDPGNAEFHMRLGMAQGGVGDAAEAERTYRGVIATHPGYHLAYRRLSDLLEGQNRYAESRDLWLELRKSGAWFVGADAKLASAYLGAGQPDEALRVAEAASTGAPDRQLDLVAGRALEALGRGADAVGRYRRALEAAPSDPDAFRRLAALLRRLGREGEIRDLAGGAGAPRSE